MDSSYLGRCRLPCEFSVMSKETDASAYLLFVGEGGIMLPDETESVTQDERCGAIACKKVRTAMKAERVITQVPRAPQMLRLNLGLYQHLIWAARL